MPTLWRLRSKSQGGKFLTVSPGPLSPTVRLRKMAGLVTLCLDGRIHPNRGGGHARIAGTKACVLPPGYPSAEVYYGSRRPSSMSAINCQSVHRRLQVRSVRIALHQGVSFRPSSPPPKQPSPSGEEAQMCSQSASTLHAGSGLPQPRRA